MVPPLLKEKYQFYYTTLCIPYILSSCSLCNLTFSQLSSNLLLYLGFVIHTRLFLISRLYLLYYALSWLPGNLPQPVSKVISSHTVLRWSDRINHPQPVRSTTIHMLLYSTFHRRLFGVNTFHGVEVRIRIGSKFPHQVHRFPAWNLVQGHLWEVLRTSMCTSGELGWQFPTACLSIANWIRNLNKSQTS